MTRIASRSGREGVGLRGRQPADDPIPAFRDAREVRQPDLQAIEALSGGQLLCRADRAPDREWILTDATVEAREWR